MPGRGSYRAISNHITIHKRWSFGDLLNIPGCDLKEKLETDTNSIFRWMVLSGVKVFPRVFVAIELLHRMVVVNQRETNQYSLVEVSALCINHDSFK
jgi:hypothetical protein